MKIEPTDHSKSYTIELCDGKEVTVAIFRQNFDCNFPSDIIISVSGIDKPIEVSEHGVLYVGDDTKDPRLLPIVKQFFEQFLQGAPSSLSVTPCRSVGIHKVEARLSFPSHQPSEYTTVAKYEDMYQEYEKKLDAGISELEEKLQQAYNAPWRESVEDFLNRESAAKRGYVKLQFYQAAKEVLDCGTNKPIADVLEDILALLPVASGEYVKSTPYLLLDLQQIIADPVSQTASEIATRLMNKLVEQGVNLVHPRRNERESRN